MKSFVLLSTFNGEQFLRQQLDSLLDQSHREWTLLYRDDGSTDRSLEILHEYSKNDSRFIPSNDPVQKSLGSTQSYSYLLGEALKNKDWDNLFFCDQDDIWNKDKIKNQNAILEKLSILYPQKALGTHCDANMIDKNNIVIHSSFKDYMQISMPQGQRIEQLLVENCVTACTLGINRLAGELAYPISPNAIMHDHWIALIVKSFGYLHYDSRAWIKYRQHSSNAVGAEKSKKTLRTSLGNSLSDGNYREEFLNRRLNQIRALIQTNPNLCSKNGLLSTFVGSLEKPSLAAIFTLIRENVHFSTLSKTLGFYLFLLLSAYSDPGKKRFKS